MNVGACINALPSLCAVTLGGSTSLMAVGAELMVAANLWKTNVREYDLDDVHFEAAMLYHVDLRRLLLPHSLAYWLWCLLHSRAALLSSWLAVLSSARKRSIVKVASRSLGCTNNFFTSSLACGELH